jgi:threonine dehydratase
MPGGTIWIVTLVSLDEIHRAQAILDGTVLVTPLQNSLVLGSLVGGPVLLKCENLQRTGSFKFRGGYLRMSRLSPAERERGVVAASAGNHAQGVALAAKLHGTRCVVFMPTGAPLPKVEATQGYGARVQMVGQTVDDALAAAQEYAAETGAVFVHPFDHVDAIAGQGTVGLEILEQYPEVKTIVAAVGGGGLISGVAAAAKGVKPDTRVVGVQAAGAAPYPPSLAARQLVTLDSIATMADGIAVRRGGELTFEHIADLVDEVVTVSEESLSRALLLCLERAKLVVEPAGAAAVAAILDDPERFEPPVVAILSGGNIDPLLLLKVIRHGMSSAGRYLSFRIMMPDRPGSLARLLAEIAALGANVCDVEHLHTVPRVSLGDVEVALSVETRGAEHSAKVLDSLRTSGYSPTFV